MRLPIWTEFPTANLFACVFAWVTGIHKVDTQTYMQASMRFVVRVTLEATSCPLFLPLTYLYEFFSVQSNLLCRAVPVFLCGCVTEFKQHWLRNHGPVVRMPRTVKRTVSILSSSQSLWSLGGRDCTPGFLHHPRPHRQERRQHVVTTTKDNGGKCWNANVNLRATDLQRLINCFLF